MYFQRFYVSCLSHASYMIGSGGIAVVIDPQRDVDLYLDAAEQQGVRIAHIIETHLHRDFVSGHWELATRAKATIHVGAKASAAFPHHVVQDGEELRFGRCVLRFLETPGHTPESVSVLVSDLDRSPEPFAVLTGDTLLIGDVGRPDLCKGHTPEELASQLYDSLQSKLLRLPDSVEVFPAHGVRSSCGSNIRAAERFTIGQERRNNKALQTTTREEFVAQVARGLPFRPDYFAQVAELNRAGVSPFCDLPKVYPLKPREVRHLAEESLGNVVLLDVRQSSEFCSHHVPSSVHIGLGGAFAPWAATLLGLDARIILIAKNTGQIAEARTRLTRVGVEGVIGYLDGNPSDWEQTWGKLRQIRQMDVLHLADRISKHQSAFQLVDVRTDAEWNHGHIAKATHRPLELFSLVGNRLNEIVGQLSHNLPVVVYCQRGYRSLIATSLLRRAGVRNLIDLAGGFEAWRQQKLAEGSGPQSESDTLMKTP